MDSLADLLTDIGLEVEKTEGPWPSLEKVVVGKVAKVSKVKGVKVKVCEVDTGDKERFSVACNAPNVRRGMRAPFALIGAKLPAGIVEERKFGEFVSSGMLCSAKELELGDDAEGLHELGRDARPGTPISSLLESDDVVHDLAITPNRGDWLSMLGVARELCAATGKRMPKVRIARLPADKVDDDRHEVVIDESAKQHCPKFTCIPVMGVDASRPTPSLVAERLQRCGVRPVSVIVDITNYVMLELGQPLHAFDRDKISGNVVVRLAKEGEHLSLLDGTEAKLKDSYLVVADEKGSLAIGGVMGGAASGITGATSNILLEAAHFVPSIVRGKCRELNIASEAAFRFERGVDPAMCEAAITRAAKMIMRHCGGRAGKLNVAGGMPEKRKPVMLGHGKVESLTGITVTTSGIRKRLKALGFGVKPSKAHKGTFEVFVPSWRFDAEIPEDLVEEVVRLEGYSTIPTTMPELVGEFVHVPERLLDPETARNRLVAQGYSEVVTYSFVDPKWERDFYGNDDPLALENPLAKEHGVMRSGLIGALVDCAIYNSNHRHDSLRIFEIGRCFLEEDLQPYRMAGLCWGPVNPDHWDRERRDHDFFDAKGAIELLLPQVELEFLPKSEVPALHPDRSATVMAANKKIGAVGEVHPVLLGKHRYDLAPAPAVFELDFDFLCLLQHGRLAAKVSKFPQVRRDLAFSVGNGIQASQLVKSAKSLGIEEVTDITVFDSFSGGQLGDGKRSVGLRITMQGIKTNLVDSRINEVMATLEKELQTLYGATVRN